MLVTMSAGFPLFAAIAVVNTWTIGAARHASR